jgi:two-component system, response regulator, stage 0 sporulation protein F
MIKLMVVDDEVEICDFVKSFFQERGFEVFSANNGQEALRLVQEMCPEIVILDLVMPIMDGMETLKNMHERNLYCKIVVVTAVDDMKKVEQAKQYGASDYITKPLLLEELDRCVAKIALELTKE